MPTLHDHDATPPFRIASRAVKPSCWDDYDIRFFNGQDCGALHAYQIRHRVYCHELAYEERREDGLEHDRFDRSAWHAVAFDRHEGHAVGCVRLVLPMTTRTRILPLVGCYEEDFPRRLSEQRGVELAGCCEVGRLAVLPDLRRRERAQRSCMGVAQMLSLAALAMFEHSELRDMLILSKDSLIRLLARYGIPFERVAEHVEHRGLRATHRFPRSALAEQNDENRRMIDALRTRIRIDALGMDHATPLANQALSSLAEAS